jgi:dihydropteroate synthase
VAASIWAGAHIVRVHDVAAMVDVARVTDALRNARPSRPMGV